MVFSDPPEIISDPKNWTMDQLTDGSFKVHEFPVTIACDGSMFSVLLVSVVRRSDFTPRQTQGDEHGEESGRSRLQYSR